MTKKTAEDPSTCIVPLYMNGLQGRMMRLPASAKATREILLVYGHHSTLERWQGLAQELNQYGAVTMPDLPGFGGMQSFYRIHEKPTLDNYADYLAAFVKMRYPRRRVTIVAMSFGFVVATRMLQRYPDIANKVDILVSAAGFSHYEDFRLSQRKLRGYRILSRLLSRPVASVMFRNIALRPLVTRSVYQRGPHAMRALRKAGSHEFKRVVDAEIRLWHANDTRTHWQTMSVILHVNNCAGRPVNLPVLQMHAPEDRSFDRHTTEQHLRVIFSDYHQATAEIKHHAPCLMPVAWSAPDSIPQMIRTALNA